MIENGRVHRACHRTVHPELQRFVAKHSGATTYEVGQIGATQAAEEGRIDRENRSLRG
jgi:hypothetical protein